MSGQFGKAEDKQAFMGEKKVAEDITNLLRSVGIDTNSDSVSSLLSDTGAFYRITRPLHNIFNILKDAKGKQENDILMKEFRGSYKKLAAEIGKVSENSIESSSNERGKTYYGHVQPSYIGTLFNKLKMKWGMMRSTRNSYKGNSASTNGLRMEMCGYVHGLNGYIRIRV